MKTFTKLFALCALCFLTNSVFAKIIYVNAANGAAAVKDGTTWANAYIDLQQALSDVTLVAGDEIWVAKGVYKPSTILGAGADNRDKTFVLKEGVMVYGGFVGGEPTSYDLATRNFVLNETILSGDIDDNDNMDGTIVGANAYHVVLLYNADNTTVLDGFTITAGKADVNTSNTFYGSVANNDHILRGSGAGIFVRKSSPTFNNLVVKGNVASILGGGGIYIGRSKPSNIASLTNSTISNSTISNNKADGATTNGQGAGIYMIGDDTFTFRIALNNVFISKNTANRAGGLYLSNYTDVSLQTVTLSENTSTTGQGAGAYSVGNAASKNKLSINDCSFSKNTSPTASGGGLAINSHSDATITNTAFVQNSANNGGGLYCVSIAGSINSLIISGATFSENTAGTTLTTTSYGGGLYLDNNTLNVLKNVVVNRNIANAAGGIYNGGASNSFDISNALFYENTAGNGGALTFAGSAGVVRNSTFYGNISTAAGGAIRLTNSTASVASVYNSIMLGNTAVTAGTADISLAGASAVATIANSITQGATGTNVTVSATAANVFLSIDPSSSDFLKLKPITGNPAINSGDDSKIPAGVNTDLAGLSRTNGTVDMGAYENFNTLPIKLLDFTAKAKNNAVQVNWLTETETDNDYFLIEKSADGINFNLLTKTFSKGNTGFSYSYTDYSPLSGTSYYRLTQVDKDGTKLSFNPVVVNLSLGNQSLVNVYPNPAIGGKIKVNLAGNRFSTLQVVNLNGQILQSVNIVTNETEKIIDISRYARGVYFIKLTDGKNILNKKIINP